jgi:hypothetical protein
MVRDFDKSPGGGVAISAHPIIGVSALKAMPRLPAAMVWEKVIIN